MNTYVKWLLITAILGVLTGCNGAKIADLEKKLEDSLARITQMQGKIAELESVNKQLSEENQLLKNTPDGRFQVAVDQIDKGQLEEATQTLKTLIANFPDSPVVAQARKSLASVNAQRAQASLSKATELEKSGDTSGALTRYKQIVASYSGSPAAGQARSAITRINNQQAAELLSQARSNVGQNDLDGAADKVSRLLSQYPNSTSAAAARGLRTEIAQRKEQKRLSDKGWLMSSLEAYWAFSRYSDMLVPRVKFSLKKIGVTPNERGEPDDYFDVRVDFFTVENGQRTSFGYDRENENDTREGLTYPIELSSSQGYQNPITGAWGAADRIDQLPRVEYEIGIRNSPLDEYVTFKTGTLERRWEWE